MELKQVLSRVGIGSGDRVLLHSSLKKIGPIEGGADMVIDVFQELLGPEGLLAVPTLPFLGSTFDYLNNDPVFDVRNTPSKMGIVTEVLRKRPGAVRSLHPTHSVAALGNGASDLLKDHEKSRTPCSRAQSPFGRLIDSGAWIILLGVTNQNNTTLHACEEYAGVPYLFSDREFACRVIDQAGGTGVVHIVCHAPGYPRDFNKLEPILEEKNIMRIFPAGTGEMRIVNAKDLVDLVVPILVREPEYLLKK